MSNFWVFVRNDIVEANLLENTMFGDALQSDLDIAEVKENSQDSIAQFLARRKFQQLTGGIFNFALAPRYQLTQILAEKAPQYDRIYVLFLNTAFTTVRFPAEILESYRKKWSNIRYILYYIDPIDRSVCLYAKYLQDQHLFDAIYTFDPEDAKKYGLIHWTTPYSRVMDPPSTTDCDLYFIGIETERLAQICAVLHKGTENAVSVKMDVIQFEERPELAAFQNCVCTHSVGDVMPYMDALRHTLNARCILELVRPNQSGFTLRAYEAVVYNRKLLTNNKNILNFKYYNPANMQYFEKVEDIDWEWVKQPITVDYGYQGDFSPVLLLKDIVKRLS